jgi:hypothetical protein
MKNPSQAVWYRATGWAAGVVALAVAFMVAPSIARAQCVGDCNGDGEVTINELISMVNIALGTSDVSTCTAGDANGDGEITINEIVAAVNNALNGCPAGGCGDGVKSGAEECDDGGICIGGTNAGTACTSETQCQGEGVCDTFGSQGPAGTVPRKACSSDSECGGAKCIHCKTFGGDGCAANCTLEGAPTVTTLVTGVLSGSDVAPGTSGAVVHGDILTIPLVLGSTCSGGTNVDKACTSDADCPGSTCNIGTSTLIAGKPLNGLIPITQKVDGTHLPRIPVSTLACACVRGTEFKTCGGTQFEADGMTVSTDCTADASLCDGKKPCTAVAGPGNAGEGVIGCSTLPSVSYTIVQDSGGSSGVSQPAIFTPGAGGGAGAQVQATASAIGTVVGLCSGTAPDYGPDGQFCTDDDPDSSRGVPSIQTLVTGTASAQILNANGIDGNDIGPFTASGNAVTCEMIAAGQTSGAIQAGAFTSLAQPTTGDIVVTNEFVAQ